MYTLRNVGSFCIKAIEIYFLIVKENRKRFRDWLRVVDYFERRKHIKLSKVGFLGEGKSFSIRSSEILLKIFLDSNLDNIVADSNKQRINITCSLESSSAFGYLHFFCNDSFAKAASDAIVCSARSTFRYFVKISQRVRKALQSKEIFILPGSEI